MAAVIGRGLQRGLDGNGDRQCLKSPFIAYYIVVYSLNAVAIIGGVVSQFDLHGSSGWYMSNFNRCDAWLVTNAIFGVLHILGASYLVRKIEEPEDGIEVSPLDYQLQQYQQQQELQQNKGGPNTQSWQVGKKVNSQPTHYPQQQWESERPVISPYAQKCMGPPQSWVRLKHVLLENFMVAIYLLIYLAYLIWHMFMDMRPCNDGMRFTQRAADIFIVASPFAFAFSVLTMFMNKRQL